MVFIVILKEAQCFSAKVRLLSFDVMEWILILQLVLIDFSKQAATDHLIDIQPRVSQV